jgi:hypothetical protein
VYLKKNTMKNWKKRNKKSKTLSLRRNLLECIHLSLSQWNSHFHPVMASASLRAVTAAPSTNVVLTVAVIAETASRFARLKAAQTQLPAVGLENAGSVKLVNQNHQ